MGNKSQSSYMDLYFKFQKRFKPVKAYESSKEIILEAVKILSEILENQEEFAKNIKLIYPNYFTEKTGGRFKPIYDNFIFFIGENVELQKRVKQHLSYYMKTKNEIKLGDTFIRISSSLIQSKVNVTLSSFFVKKENDKYLLKIKNDAGWQPESEIKVGSDGFPVLLNDIYKLNDLELIKYGNDLAGAYVFNVKEGDLVSLPEKVVQVDSDFASSEDFIEAFAQPLSAHLVMLEEASMLYVYSQTAQIGSSASNLGYGGMFVLLDKGIYEPEDVDLYRDFFQLVSDSISSCIAHNIMRKKLLCEAVKSAKAAIMSRNMSHNLGSHVMFYIKQRLESVEKILQTGTLKELVNSVSLDDIKKKISDKTAVVGDELPFLVGLGRFINYLQERQDYIATIATDYIPSNSVINFKDCIYDELKPDLRSKRHSGDVKGRLASNLLLDYIAYSEGFTESNRIELQFGENFNGDGTVPDELRKFNVALPGGTLGRQAFFSIMENIIRNTAKHDGSKVGNGKLVFRFEIIDGEELKNTTDKLYYTKPLDVEMTDELVTKAYDEYRNKYYYLGISVVIDQNKKDADDTVEKIGKALNCEYISNGVMDDKCRGIKEIRLSAAWLRGENLDYDVDRKEPPAVTVRCQNGNLQYIICLSKPKKLAFVVKKLQDALLNKKDYGCFTEEEISTHYKDIADYELVVIDKTIDMEKRKKLVEKIGSRVFCDTYENIKKFIQGDLSSVYKAWLEKTFKLDETFSPQISILDTKALSSVHENGNVPGLNILVKDTAANDNAYYENCILFNTHYPGQPKLEEVNRQLFAKARFVEGISGGNSTDRLIRHDKRDYEWYAKHVAAGLTKVVVFDERIYSFIMPEGKIEKEPEDRLHEIEVAFREFFEKHQKKSVSDLSDFLRNNYSISETQIARNLINGLGWGESKSNVYASKVLEMQGKSSPRDYSNVWKYREKGIWVYNVKIVETIVETEKKKVGEIIGYNAPVSKQIGLFSEDYKEVKIGAITMNDGKVEINFVDKNANNNAENKFDFICIHQGILDKIYEALKDDKKNKNNLEKYKVDLKKQVTQKFYEKFSHKDEECVEKPKDSDAHEFLPRFIIHSGRSKPNEEDMPQKQPFLQFAALDHAIRDCKYTLSELLYSVHYEP